MREEYWRPVLWLLVVGSWTFGVAYGRWMGANRGFFLELSRAVSVPSPLELEAWWGPLAYFSLSVMAVFVLAQLLFSAGAVVFLFSRGVHDSILIAQLEANISGWSLPDLPMREVWMAVFIVLILAVNLPLCIWAAHMGTQRSIYTWHRLTGKFVRPESGVKPMTNFLLILAASIAAGLVASLILPYAK
jgi:hypothetical protein